MGGNGGKGRGEICREEESLIWIAKCEGRDLEGRELKGFDGYFLLRFQSL